MKENYVYQRTLKVIAPDGRRMTVTASLGGFAGQPPHFSVTSQHGADHEAILAAAPELEPVVRVHLSEKDGIPMHAVANLIYHLQNGDFKTAVSHVHGATSLEDMMLLAGRAKIRADESAPLAQHAFRVLVKDRTEAVEKAEQALARVKHGAALPNGPRVQEAKGAYAAANSALEKISEHGAEKKYIESSAAAVYKKVVEEYVTANLLPQWQQMADAALEVVKRPDFTSPQWIEPDADPRTYDGFLKSRNVEFEPVFKGMLAKAPYDENSTAGAPFSHWKCEFKSPLGSHTVDFYMASGHAGITPVAKDALETLQSDARIGAQSFSDFCSEFGYDEDSRKSERVWKACAEIAQNLAKFLSAEDVTFFMEEVSDDAPIPEIDGHGGDAEETAPSMG